MIDVLHSSHRLSSLRRALDFRPTLFFGTIGLSFVAAIFEGIGLSFIIPIVELAQEDSGTGADGSRFVEAFEVVYSFLGIPLTLETLIVGSSIVIAIRYTLTFVVTWLKTAVEMYYRRELQLEVYERLIGSRVDITDERGSDEVINTIVTQAANASQTLIRLLSLVEQLMLSIVYLSISLYLAPLLTVLAGLLLGGVTVVIRYALEEGYDIGDRVRIANEEIQSITQTTINGIRDVKTFNMGAQLIEQFRQSVNEATESNVTLRRNQAAMNNIHQGITAITLFVIIYVALRFTSLSLGSLGLFLFAMFRLSPRVSRINNIYYNIEGKLPHLVQTHEFIDTLGENQEPTISDPRDVPDSIETVAFDCVDFSYEAEPILDDVSFDVSSGEFIAFVGPSGAGKSTIVSLLARLYSPDDGTITVNGVPIDEFDIGEWREAIALVRQAPYVFDETLSENIAIGDPSSTEAERQAAAEASGVTEFVEDLPSGFNTRLGEDAITLSGGQRQRVAIARALLKDTDVLILDEATSDLDRELEAQVHRRITDASEDRILIVVAHRLSTVRDADRIFTMKDGEIVEAGTHDELTEQGGTYAQLYDTKF